MHADRTDTTAAKPARPVRRRPLVSPDLVRRWAAQAGLRVPEGELDEATVELYLYWHRERPSTGGDIDIRPTTPPAWRAQGMAPPVSPAALLAVSGASTPEPCPTCGRPGYLACVDLARAVQRHECHPCGHQWASVIARASSPT